MTRFYRYLVRTKSLKVFSVKNEETDLQVYAEKDLTRLASKEVQRVRAELIDYIARHPEFKNSHVPVGVPDDAPDIVEAMATAASAAGTGAMAAVAGAVAELVGRALLNHSVEVIVENGGDIFIRSERTRTIAIFAGESPLSLKIGMTIDPSPGGVGACTSSATVGHSLSVGRADAVLIVAENAALADAVATATCNRVTLPSSLEPAMNFACSIGGVNGCCIILGTKLAAAGTGFTLTDFSVPPDRRQGEKE